MDALNSSFIKEDVAKANPVSLSESMSVTKESERIDKRLNPH